MNKDVANAFRTIISVPLGGETEKEYLEMKEAVCRSLDVIANAANFTEELNQAYQHNINLMQSPEFHKFIEALTDKKKAS